MVIVRFAILICPSRLADGDNTIMASCAVVNNARMVKHRARKRFRTEMANSTILCGWHVIGGEAGSDHPIVTGHTIVNNTRMIKDTGGKGKGAGDVANTAILVSSDGHVI